MNNPELLDRINSIKAKIEAFIGKGYIAEADNLLEQLYEKMPGDPEVCSMRAVTRIIGGKLDEAEAIVKEGLRQDSVHFDLLFNLGYIREQQGLDQEAADLYCKSDTIASTSEQKQNVDIALNRLKSVNSEISYNNKPKIVFFVKKGLDSFLGDIIDNLEKSYWTRKIIVNDLKQIDKGMEWADICWFEWCDELVAYGSKLPLAGQRNLICRLHRYEVFTDIPNKVNWQNIKSLIIVTANLKLLLDARFPGLFDEVNIEVVKNGVDVNRYQFKRRSGGFNLAAIGYLHSRKNPAFLLQIIKKLVDIDNRYKLYVAGEFQEETVKLYWDYQISRMSLQNNVVFNGWENNVSSWLEDKNYLISASIHESFGYGIAEAMASGIKPVIHDFLFANDIWDEKYLYNTIDEAVEMIRSRDYNSDKYRDFIKNYYSLDMQISKVKSLLDKVFPLKTIFGRVKDIIERREKPEDLSIQDLTILAPCYNRAAMVKGDFDKGFNFPLQAKLLVDDFSDAENRKILRSLLDHSECYGRTDIIFHDKNLGVAAAFKTGVQAVTTKYILCKGDDDILLGSGSYEDVKETVLCIGIDVAFITPRYIINYAENNELSIGYDRIGFDNKYASDILRVLFLQGELYCISAGAIFSKADLLGCLPEDIFKVSEDYVATTRILDMYKNLKVRVTEEYTYLRRVSDNSLSRTVNETKLALNLFSMMISGFYCLKHGLVNESVFADTFIKREELLGKLYNFRAGLANMIIDYSFGSLKFEAFVLDLRTWGIEVHNIDELPKEIVELPKLLTI